MNRSPITADLVVGAVDLEPTADGLLPHRLPADARQRNVDGQLAMAEAQPSGVRLRFRTAARAIEVEARATKRVYVGGLPRPDGHFDVVVDGREYGFGTIPGGNRMLIDMTTGSARVEPGEAGRFRLDDLPAGDKTIEIWLPHDETTELIALYADQPVTAAESTGRRVWLHHGSSISHGSNADHPTGTWPAVAARRAGVDLVNLGFGGSAVLDPFVSRAIAEQPCDVISLKLGINLVNLDAMRLRVFGPAVHGFLDLIRDRRPDVPLLLVSPICCPIHEETPGPAMMDMEAVAAGALRFRAVGDPNDPTRLTLRRIREVLASVVAVRDDPNLHYLDGLRLYGEQDAQEMPLPDDLHPEPETHRLIGERFADLAFGTGGPLAG